MAKTPENGETAEEKLIAAVVEIVHQGYGALLDASQLRGAFEWQPHCSMNYEYVFTWNNLSAESAEKCQWADLSFVTDSRGREVYILEMADAVTTDDDDLDEVIARHEEIWKWKSQPLTVIGPFVYLDEAEEWMSENGTFEEAD